MPNSRKAVEPATGEFVPVYYLLIAALVTAVQDLQTRVKALEG